MIVPRVTPSRVRRSTNEQLVMFPGNVMVNPDVVPGCNPGPRVHTPAEPMQNCFPTNCPPSKMRNAVHPAGAENVVGTGRGGFCSANRISQSLIPVAEVTLNVNVATVLPPTVEAVNVDVSPVSTGNDVGVGVGVRVAVAVGVRVAVLVAVGVRVRVRVSVGVGVALPVGVGVGVTLPVGVGEPVGVGVPVAVKVGDGVAVSVGVADSVGVGVSIGAILPPPPPKTGRDIT